MRYSFHRVSGALAAHSAAPTGKVVECKRCSSGKHDGESTDGDVEPIRSIAEAIRTFIEGLHGRAGSSAI